MRFGLILMMRDIHINFNLNLNPLTKFNSSSRSNEFKDIISWIISQMTTKTIPISTRIVKGYVNGGKAVVGQILASEERNPK